MPAATPGGIGALGFEVNLLKLGGLSGEVSQADRDSAATFREMQFRAAIESRDRQRQSREQRQAIEAAREAAQESYDAQQRLLSHGGVQLKDTLSRVQIFAMTGIGALLLYKVFAGRKKRKKKS